MTDFLDQLEADLREAAENRGQRHRQRRPPVLKAVAVVVALALVVAGATRLFDAPDRRQAAQPTPTPSPSPHRFAAIAVATEGDPALLDVLSARLGGYVRLAPSAQPRTADPALGTVVLYRPAGEETARYVASVEKIDRVEPLTPAEEDRIGGLAGADVVVVYGREREQRMLDDPKTCAPAGGPFKLCLDRSDEKRYSRFVVDDRPLAVDPITDRGWWSWAAASPDGQTLLAQWTDDCERAALIPADGGAARVLAASRALGWTTDGRAIVYQGEKACAGGAELGVYLVTPDGEATLVGPGDRGLERSLEPRAAPRAAIGGR